MTDAIPVHDLEEISSLPRGPFKRHFTATGFLVFNGSVLLHWHAKVLEWLPPGGHIEPNEDPVQAVLREIKEETGLRVEIYGTPYLKESGGFPCAIAEPRHILIENIDDPVDGVHQHIDMIYACKPKMDISDAFDGWIWVGIEDLIKEKSFITPSGELISPPEDVKVLGKRSLDLVRKFG